MKIKTMAQECGHYTQLFGDYRNAKRLNKLAVYHLHLKALLANRYVEKQRYYQYLNEKQVFEIKKSDTIFIFGSGFSIRDIQKEEWQFFENHNTLSFNWFIYQKFCQMDYHLVRETYAAANTYERILKVCTHYADIIKNNSFYSNTALLIQKGWKASAGNIMLGNKLLKKDSRIYRFNTTTRGGNALPSDQLSKGLAHAIGTLCDAVNFAIIGGWKNIVLVGVDLYDMRYFWLGENEHNAGRGSSVSEKHNTAKNGVILLMERWQEFVGPDNHQMYVYNPKSLLNTVLPIYDSGLK